MDKLLTLLKQNARLSNAQLATMLAITEEEVASKIAKYEADGIIKGYAAILDDELADKNSVSAFIASGFGTRFRNSRLIQKGNSPF